MNVIQMCARWALAVGLLTGLCADLAAAADGGTPGYYRQPALRGDAVFFVAEGDLWRVSAGGGRAERVTSHPGAEVRPAVAPDGRHIAYTASYEGPAEAYVMPVQGGLPQRLTWDGRGAQVWGYTPAGDVLFTSRSESGRPVSQLYAVNPATGVRRTLPVAQASDGALAGDGRTLYFTRGGLGSDNVRAYRGGAMARLWQVDLTANTEARPLLALDANARAPMPYSAAGQARVAFLSDRSGSFNVWSVDAHAPGNDHDLRQHTRHTAWDVRSAAIDGARVVYALGADLHVLDLLDGSDRKLDITLGSDFDQQRTRWVAAPPFFTDAALAPNGERVLIAARGHLATQGTGALRRAELPVPADAACKAGAFSHDSRHVYALCDSSGEVEIWRFAANGSGAPLRITQGGSVQRKAVFPSPDGRWLAHTDHSGRLHLTAITAAGGGATQTIARGPEQIDRQKLWWSPDSKSLVFVLSDPASGRNQLVLYTLGSPTGAGAAAAAAHGTRLVLTTDRYDADAPAFTPDGQWLYFLSDRRFEALVGFPWGDRNLGPFFDRRTGIFALALQPGLRFPFKPRDELTPASAVRPLLPVASTATASATAGATTATATVTVRPPAQAPAAAASAASAPAPAVAPLQRAGLAQRLHEVPLPAGNYRGLATDGKRLFFLDTERGSSTGASLRSLAIDDTGAPPELFSADVQDFEITPDGKRLMVVRSPPRGSASPPAPAPRAGDIWLLDTAPKPPTEPAALARVQVRWADWQMAIEPRSEWQQLFADAWRLQRDYLFDAGMQGVDWAAQRRQYAALLPRVADRAELADLMAQMVTSLGVLHSQVGAPDVRGTPNPVAPAALGARFTPVADGLRVERVFQGDPELPSEASPLAPAQVMAGDTITAVNGRSARGVLAVGELLRGQEGRQVLLDIQAANGMQRAVVVTPVTVRRDEDLRVGDWEWGLAEKTLQQSQGRIGYLRLRAMVGADIGTFAREFYSHIGRDGLVIDVRGNNGGSIDSWVIEKLLRRAWMFWQRRAPEGAAPFANMQQTFRGHIAVLVDQDTYSDGETFSEGIQRLGIGTLVGTRTSGAGVWLSDSNRLIDNGIVRAAETAQFTLDGQWLIERVGVAPDIVVDLPPRATAGGGDAQLDAALAHLQARIAAQPVPVPKPPPYARPFEAPGPGVPAGR